MLNSRENITFLAAVTDREIGSGPPRDRAASNGNHRSAVPFTLQKAVAASSDTTQTAAPEFDTEKAAL